MDFELFELPERVQTILNELHTAGYEAYVVGGCVRDLILGNTPNDWDITTSAKPEEVKEIFSRTVDVGIEHGTVKVMFNNIGYEVTTYRIDGEYEDNRHPSSVEFTTDLAKDLIRRDFTINAMAYNNVDGIVDLYGGREDLEKQIIKCVGNPDARFNEDALRMMRAIRFSAQLDFNIEDETLNAIKRNAHLIKNVSYERIRDEIGKIIMSNHPEKFLMLNDVGLLEYIMPEFVPNINCAQNSPWHKYTVDKHIIKTVANIEKNYTLKWTMLLHDIGKAPAKTTDSRGYDHFLKHPEIGAEIADKILTRYNFDAKTHKKIVRLIKFHDLNLPLDEPKLRKAISIMGEELFIDLLKVMNADDSAKAEVVWIENKEKNEALRQMYLTFKEQKQCLNRKELKITGDMLMDIGYTQGKEVGDAIEYLFDQVLLNPKMNDEYQLKRLAEKRYDTIKILRGEKVTSNENSEASNTNENISPNEGKIILNLEDRNN